jgi:arginine deiminase
MENENVKTKMLIKEINDLKNQIKEKELQILEAIWKNHSKAGNLWVIFKFWYDKKDEKIMHLLYNYHSMSAEEFIAMYRYLKQNYYELESQMCFKF